MTLEEATSFFQNLVNLVFQNGQVTVTPAQFQQLNDAWIILAGALDRQGGPALEVVPAAQK